VSRHKRTCEVSQSGRAGRLNPTADPSGPRSGGQTNVIPRLVDGGGSNPFGPTKGEHLAAFDLQVDTRLDTG
jgi:hypothetical protein